jgi:molybdopterin-binding protein
VGAVRLSARNVLKGKVKNVNHGAVNSEVVIELTGGEEVVSVITKASAENLGLAEGKEVYAVVKATNVMVAID